jgi:hypothetical protein
VTGSCLRLAGKKLSGWPGRTRWQSSWPDKSLLIPAPGRCGNVTGVLLCLAMLIVSSLVAPLSASARGNPKATAYPRVRVSSSLFPPETDIARLLTDDDPGTYWHIATSDVRLRHWLLLDYGPAGARVDTVRALPRADAPEGFWDAAQLVASNNGYVWTRLANLSRSIPPVAGEWMGWRVPAPGVFRFYRVEILSGWTLNRDFFALSELRLHRATFMPGTDTEPNVSERNPVQSFAARLSPGWTILAGLGVLAIVLAALRVYRGNRVSHPSVAGAVLGVVVGCLLWLTWAVLATRSHIGSLAYVLPVAGCVGSASYLIERRYRNRYPAVKYLNAALGAGVTVLILALVFIEQHSGFYYYNGDVREVYLPFRWLMVDRLRHGEVALWNPYVGTGAPNVVWGHVPIDLFTLVDLIVWPQPIRYEAYLVVTLVLLVGAMFLMFRQMGLGWLEALVPAVSYPSMPFVAHYFLQIFTFHSLLTLPLFMFATLRYLLQPRRRLMICLILIVALSFFGTKAEFWLFQVIAFLYIYVGCGVLVDRTARADGMFLGLIAKRVSHAALIIGGGLLLNSWHLALTVSAVLHSARTTGFNSLGNLLHWPLYRESMLSFVESEYWQSVGLLALFWLQMRAASAIFGRSRWSSSRWAGLLVGAGAAATTVMAALVTGARFEYLEAFWRSRGSWSLVAACLGYMLLAATVRESSGRRQETWRIGDLCLALGMALLPVFHLFKSSNPSEALEIRRFGVVASTILLFFSTVGAFHFRRVRIIVLGWGGVLLVLLMREHVQGVLIQGLGMVWHPKRDAYVLFFFLLIPVAHGVRFFWTTMVLAVRTIAETAGARRDSLSMASVRWGYVTFLAVLGTAGVALLYEELLNCRCQFAYGPHYAERASAFVREIARSLPPQIGEDAAHPYRVAALPTVADYRRDLWTGEFPLNPHILLQGRIADARLYNSTPDRTYSELSNYVRYGAQFDPNYPIINHTFPREILRFYPSRFRGAPAPVARDLKPGESIPLGGYALLRNGLMTLHPNVLGILNVRFLLTLEPLTPAAFGYMQHTIPQDYAAMRLVKSSRIYSPHTKRTETIYVYENTRALPRAFVVHEYVCGQDFRQAIDWILMRQFSARTTAVIDCSGSEEPVRPRTARDGETVVRSYAASRVVVETRLAHPGLLVLSDSMFPGWRALVDGNVEEVRRVDHAFRGVNVPAGSHRVEFRFEPTGVWIGGFLSAGSLAMLAVLWVWPKPRLAAGGPATRGVL